MIQTLDLSPILYVVLKVWTIEKVMIAWVNLYLFMEGNKIGIISPLILNPFF